MKKKNNEKKKDEWMNKDKYTRNVIRERKKRSRVEGFLITHVGLKLLHAYVSHVTVWPLCQNYQKRHAVYFGFFIFLFFYFLKSKEI